MIRRGDYVIRTGKSVASVKKGRVYCVVQRSGSDHILVAPADDVLSPYCGWYEVDKFKKLENIND